MLSVAALSAYEDSSLVDGEIVFLASVGYLYLDKASVGVVNGTTIFATKSTVGRWLSLIPIPVVPPASSTILFHACGQVRSNALGTSRGVTSLAFNAGSPGVYDITLTTPIVIASSIVNVSITIQGSL